MQPSREGLVLVHVADEARVILNRLIISRIVNAIHDTGRIRFRQRSVVAAGQGSSAMLLYPKFPLTALSRASTARVLMAWLERGRLFCATGATMLS